MTTKSQSLLSELGDNMAESLGFRQPSATPPEAVMTQACVITKTSETRGSRRC